MTNAAAPKVYKKLNQKDFEEMPTAELQERLARYQQIYASGELPGGGRGLEQAEQIRLRFYIACCEGILKKR